MDSWTWTKVGSLALALAATATWTGWAAAQPISPEELVEVYQKLLTPDVDQERYLDVAGKTLQREDLVVTFTDGVVHPVVRSDGKVMGLAFVGSGQVAFSPPDAREQRQLERYLGSAPYEHGFTNAWIMATDDTVDVLLGEGGEWATGGGAPVKAKTVHDNRHSLYRDPMWHDYGPSLEMDVLDDLYGEGYKGGHFYAEFGVDPVRWLTYYRNPRWALYPGEEIAVFIHAPRGAAPQTMEVVSSYRSSDPNLERALQRPYDLSGATLDVTVPPAKGTQDLSQVDVAATLEFVALQDGVTALQTELLSRRPKCKGDVAFAELEVSSARDFADELVPAIHDRNRLFVVLRGPMNRGEKEILQLEYGGPLLEGVSVADDANVFFTPLQDFAWYPRPLWPDRHALKTTVHAPKFMRGVATGVMIEEADEDGGRKNVYEEKGGVLSGMFAIGEYVLTEDEQDGVRIQVFTSQRDKQNAKDIIGQAKAMISYFGQLWGPYPYGSLTLVDLPPLPAGNWKSEATASIGATQEAGWNCSPPGHLYAWQGFTTSDTACLSYLLPATAPAMDEMETQQLDFYFSDTPEAAAAYTASQVARQWWGQFVGPASYRERWITESAVMLSAALYMGTFVSPKARENRIKAWHRMALRRDTSGALVTGDRLGHDFPDVVWGKGPAVMQMLMDEVGGDPFVNLMRSVMNRAPMGILTNELFAQVAAEYVGEDMQAFWDYWIEGTDVPGLRYSTEIVDSEQKGKFAVDVVLVFEDGAPPPSSIPVELKISNKDVRYRMIEVEGERTEFRIDDLDAKPKRVTVDPNQLVLLRYRNALKE